jgi:hypothetical protein
MCSTITTGTLSALLTISAVQSIKIGTVDVGAKLINLEGKISSNTSNISSNTSSISGLGASVVNLNNTVYGFGVFPFGTPGLVDMTAINTSSIAGLSTSVGIANGRIDDNDNDISSLNSNKQNKLTAQTDIISKNIMCNNLILNPPDIEDISKGTITATLISTNILSALSQITVNGVDVGAKLNNFEGRISSNTSGISSLSSALNTKPNTLIPGNNITIEMITDVSGISSNIISG